MSARRIVTTLSLALCLSAPLTASAAPPNGPATTAPAKAKMVKLTLRNTTAQPMTLMISDAPVTIAANADYKLNAPEGTDVYNEAHTAVQLHVTRDLAGTTVSFR